MSTSPDVVSLFPHATILATHPPGQAPTYETLHPAITQLNANAASIPSNSGDGTLGHIVLTIGQASYQTISNGNVAYPPPVAPAPLIIPQGTSAAMIAELRRNHDDATAAFNKYNAVDAALKKQILDATDVTYITSLKDRTTGFARVTTRQLIEHLYNNYGRITVETLTDNEARMKQPWDVTTPIELLFEQIDDGQAYATAGGEPYTDPQLVRFGYHNIEAAKRMELACRDWRAKPAADKTWNNLKLEMKAAHLDLNLTLTTDTGGYGAHQAEEIDEGYLANMIDHQKVTTATITALMETVQLLSNQVKDFAAKPKPDNKEANKSSGCNDNAKARRNLRAEHNKNKHYCWTHGCRASKDHTSVTCKTPAEGHKTTATYDNRMGGSNVWSL